MAKKKQKSLLEVYASRIASDPLVRDEAVQRLEAVYNGDPQQICYTSECASKKILRYGNSEFGEQPDPTVVRVDFASWLVINKLQPGEKSAALTAEQEWRLMERTAKLEDKTLCLMMLEAGYSPVPPVGLERSPSALQLFIAPITMPVRQADGKVHDSLRGANASDVHEFLVRVPAADVAEVAAYVDGKGHSAVHVATHNPNVGVMSALHKAGVDLDLIWRPALGNYEPKRAAHMAVLAGNAPVVAELGALAPQQFQATPACPVTPYEMGMARIAQHRSTVPSPVSFTIKKNHLRNPMQAAPAANPAEEEAIRARAVLLQRVMEATDIAAGFLGVPSPFGNTAKADAALRAAGGAVPKRHLN